MSIKGTVILHSIDLVQNGFIISRPSKTCKSPYVADVELANNEITMVHTPSLGCCGLVERQCHILVSKIHNTSKSKKTTCTHRAELAYLEENEHVEIIGVNPSLAEYIAENALIHNCIQGLTLMSPSSYSKQTTILF